MSYLHSKIQLLDNMQYMDSICCNRQKHCFASINQIMNVLLHFAKFYKNRRGK